MKKTICMLVSVLLLAGCTGTRGYVGNQEVCENDYLLGVISISEMVSPCKK